MVSLAFSSHAEETPSFQTEAAADRSNCITNLKIIYDAIQAYQLDHKDLPNWLSDLVPAYLNDANVLICPACRRNGQQETGPMSDPKISSSYIYQFCPVPMRKAMYPGNPPKTQREWKRRQMGLAGSVVPLVICRHHALNLNLGYDGKIYESNGQWEKVLTNKLNIAELTPRSLFAEELKTKTKAIAPAAANNLKFPPRAANTPTNAIDLTHYYNVPLNAAKESGSQFDFESLPTGWQKLAGIDFDLRGVIQLNSQTGTAVGFPKQVKGIKINQFCHRIHFLQAAVSGHPGEENHVIGNYTVHFMTNQWQLEIPIIYGHHLLNWQGAPDEKITNQDLVVAWTGTNTMATNNERLFDMIWENVAPAVKIESIDFTSAMDVPAPLLVAVTLEQ